MSEWKKVKIGDFLTESKIIAIESNAAHRITVRLNCKGVEQRSLKAEKEGATKYYTRKSGQFIYGKQNIHKGAFGIIPQELDGFTSSADLPAFDVDLSKCIPEWICICLQKDEYYKTLQKNVKGVGSQRLAVNVFLDSEIPLPPVEKQVEIIKKIKLQLQKTEQLSVEIESQKNYIKQLRQNILQKAIEGKLTADWRKQNSVQKGNPDYDAEALFEQIQKEHNKSIKNKSRSSNTIQDKLDDDFDLNIPQSWLFIRLSELGILERGKSKHRPRNDPSLFSDGKYPFVQTGDVSQSKYFGYEIQPASKFYNEFGLAQSKMWCAGTLCITIAANIAETGFLTYDACFPDSVVGFTPFIEGDFSTFVRYYIDSIKLILEKYAPATAQKNINLGILETLKIPLPPLAEQKEIVVRVEKHLQTISNLENQITEREELAKQLIQNILKESLN
ncbi:restriction endonuclease subunit S [Treponema sp.]|uniref:restriction endonuclease subunit S n=1 Tax=Treponema sp. TaxID=166 RepID=UPI00257BCFD6|nr:restriction endonuclease subunit S [Treponema sp.]